MRQAILRITPELLIELLKGFHHNFKGRFEVIQDGLPEDTRFVDCSTQDKTIFASQFGHEILIKIESKEFAERKEGEKLPTIKPPLLRTIYQKKERREL